MQVVLRPEIALPLSCRLGESPVWDERLGRLMFVDILAGELYSWAPGEPEPKVDAHDGELAAVLLAEDGGRVLAIDHCLRIEHDGRLGGVLAAVETDKDDNRLNDCRSDPAGRIWAGTMSRSRSEGQAALYRLDADGRARRIIAATTISNGIGWSPDRSRMYFIDSLTYRIDVFDYDVASGAIDARRPFAVIDPAAGLPDGLAVDVEGGVWLCLFGGGAIRRYSANGELLGNWSLPITNPTCPTFGGEDLQTIYITSARHRLSEAQLAAEPQAGALLGIRAPVAGMPAPRAAIPTTITTG